MWRGEPSTMALTRLMLGFQARLERLCEWETLIPKVTPFPQISHFAIYCTSFNYVRISQHQIFYQIPARKASVFSENRQKTCEIFLLFQMPGNQVQGIAAFHPHRNQLLRQRAGELGAAPAVGRGLALLLPPQRAFADGAPPAHLVPVRLPGKAAPAAQVMPVQPALGRAVLPCQPFQLDRKSVV